MPPSLALIVWLVLLFGLLYFDPANMRGTSSALWVPVIWMFFIGSRQPAQWVGGQAISAAEAFQEGNPLDRSVLTLLIVIAIGVLASRSFQWGRFFAQNQALVVLLAFAMVSALWSDFPFVAIKRWFRDFGNYLMILVVLSDPLPLEAVKALLRRLAYLLIPLSIVLVKYFLYLAVHYDPWTGRAEYVGAATSKNMLGVMCLVSGIFFFWDTVTRWAQRKEPRTKRILAVNFAFLGMVLWLLNLSNSATSRVCLLLGCMVILVASSKWGKRGPVLLKALIPLGFCLYLVLWYGLDLQGLLASQVGRDPTLTGRTEIWKAVLSLHTNWLLGTGYESFWLGPRLNYLWPLTGQVNEAHNGYLEVYLTLGIVGVILLGIFMIASYRTICRKLGPEFGIAPLALSLWTVSLYYNMTESAAFNGQLFWVIFLLVTIGVYAAKPMAENAVSANRSELQPALRAVQIS